MNVVAPLRGAQHAKFDANNSLFQEAVTHFCHSTRPDLTGRNFGIPIILARGGTTTPYWRKAAWISLAQHKNQVPRTYHLPN